MLLLIYNVIVFVISLVVLFIFSNCLLLFDIVYREVSVLVALDVVGMVVVDRCVVMVVVIGVVAEGLMKA